MRGEEVRKIKYLNKQTWAGFLALAFAQKIGFAKDNFFHPHTKAKLFLQTVQILTLSNRSLHATLPLKSPVLGGKPPGWQHALFPGSGKNLIIHSLLMASK